MKQDQHDLFRKFETTHKNFERGELSCLPTLVASLIQLTRAWNPEKNSFDHFSADRSHGFFLRLQRETRVDWRDW